MANINGKTVQFYLLSSDTSSDVLIDAQIDGTISVSNPHIENTDKNDSARSILGQTVPAYDIDITMNFDAADAGQDKLRTAITAGSSVTIKRWDSAASTASATGYITDYSESVPNNDIVTATATIVLDGDGSLFL